MALSTRIRILSRPLLGSLTFALLTMGSGAAQAQDTKPAAGEDNGEIVVTALRREELAKDVPVAVTAIGGEKLDVLNSGGQDIRFLAARTPSLQAESSFGRTFPRFYIRGLGNTDFDPNAAQPVSVVYDDVALENPMLKSFPVFDLDSVEVLRGPQGTLFGRNTPAGVIKLDSARPNDVGGGYVNASFATYDTLNIEGAVNIPLAEGLSLRTSGLLQYRKDWVTNTSAGVADRKLEGYRDRAGRIQLGYSHDGFNLLLNFHVRDLVGTPRVFRAGLFKPGSDNQFNAGFDPSKVALDGYTSQSLKQWGANARIDYHFEGLGTLYSITAFEKAVVESTGDIDGGNCYAFLPNCTLGNLNVAAFPVNTGGVTQPEEFSQEIRFASEDMNGVRVQGGVYYFFQALTYHEYNYFQGTGNRGADRDQDIFHDDSNENWGIFASGEFKATEALTLRAGLRYSSDHKHDRVSGFSTGLFGYVLPVRAEVRGSNVTWDASATYALTPEVNVYARVATGYQGPAIQDRVTFGSRQTTAPKQSTISAEGGIKGALADRTLNFAITGYWFRTDDLQITAVGGASNSARLLSADHAVGYGLEGELEWRPLPGLVLTASGSYNFTEIRDPSISVGVCGNCTVTDPIVSGRAVIDGNDLPQAPRFVGNLTAGYSHEVRGGTELFIYTDWAYRSSINYFLYDAKEFRGRPLLEGGLRAGIRYGDVELSVFGRNITNQIRSISGIDFNNLTGMINDPRIIGGAIKVKF